MKLVMLCKRGGQTIIIKQDHSEQTLGDMIDDFFKPILHWLGYHPETIEEYFKEE